jgi:peptidoglycan/xylan/chitin deacetylase (PgdA/CDA1 family)
MPAAAPTVAAALVEQLAPVAPIAPIAPIAPVAPAVFSVPQGALFTFDDCEARPGQGTTANYINVLKAHHVSKAIFFLTGNCYVSRPDIVRMVRDAGYTIGNHTRAHADLTRLSVAGIDEQIEGGPASTVFRPPYGAHNAVIDARVAAHHLQNMMWSASGGDSGGGVARTCDRILEDLLNTIKPGSIVLLHLFNTQSPAALDAYLAGRKDCDTAKRGGSTNP